MDTSNATHDLIKYAEAIKANERNYRAWLGMARCLQKMGRTDEALKPILCALVFADQDDDPYKKGLHFLAENKSLLHKTGAVLVELLGDISHARVIILKLSQYANEHRNYDRDIAIRLMRLAWELDRSNRLMRSMLVKALLTEFRYAPIIEILGNTAHSDLSTDEARILSAARACTEAAANVERLNAISLDRNLDLESRAQALRRSVVTWRLNSKAAEMINYRQSRYMDYPMYLHLETLARCNAACSFCPYPGLERKGERMPDELVYKILGDLRAIPKDLPFKIAPFKVSDPFLEKRLFDIIDYAAGHLPSASIVLITNGAAMTDRSLERLLACKNIERVSISLNDHRPDHYEGLMKIPFSRTIERMRALHALVERGECKFEVLVTRVIDGSAADILFREWVRAEFPRFQVGLAPRNDWIGQMDLETSADAVPDVGCNRWFMMSITATGKVALCCMDGEEKYVVGDASQQHILDIYNLPSYRVMRETLDSRKAAAPPCNGCTYA